MPTTALAPPAQHQVQPGHARAVHNSAPRPLPAGTVIPVDKFQSPSWPANALTPSGDPAWSTPRAKKKKKKKIQAAAGHVWGSFFLFLFYFDLYYLFIIFFFQAPSLPPSTWASRLHSHPLHPCHSASAHTTSAWPVHPGPGRSEQCLSWMVCVSR